MKKLVVVFTLLVLAFVSSAQKTSLADITPPEEYDNIHVEKLTSDERSSVFVIWVKIAVKPHKHETHTETLYVLEGSAKMKLNQEIFTISPGDFIDIPMGVVHSIIKVTSKTPLKVLSTQAPEFLGKDRVFIEE